MLCVRAHQRPFALHLLESTQQELPTAARLFDLAAHRFDGPFRPGIEPNLSRYGVLRLYRFLTTDSTGFHVSATTRHQPTSTSPPSGRCAGRAAGIWTAPPTRRGWSCEQVAAYADAATDGCCRRASTGSLAEPLI